MYLNLKQWMKGIATKYMFGGLNYKFTESTHLWVALWVKRHYQCLSLDINNFHTFINISTYI